MSSSEAEIEVDDGGVFEEGDGKVLGLSTDKNDGKFLGIIPNPRANNEDDLDVDADADVDLDTENETAVGSPGTTDTGRSSSQPK